MKTYTTHTFTLQAPKQFELVKQNPISVCLQDFTPQSSVQNPRVKITLVHISSYDYLPKDSLKEQFFEAILKLRHKAESIDCFETEINGRNCYVQLAQTDDTLQNKPLKIRYYFVLMPVNEEYTIEMQCDVESQFWETYLPFFEAIFKSVHHEGNLEKCDEAERKYDEELSQSIKQNHVDSQQESKKKWTHWLNNYIASVEKTDSSIFQIGDTNFELIWDKNAYAKTQWYINQQFYCDVVAKAENIERMKEEKILSEYNDIGELKISFTYSGLFQNGFPSAEIDVENDKIQSDKYFNFYFDGKDYSLHFNGKLFVDAKGVKIFGYLDDFTQKIPVNIQVAFEHTDLDWKVYYFSTVDELQMADNELVRHININKITDSLPDDWKRFRALKTLQLGYRYNIQSTGVDKIPVWINQLQQMETLSISSPLLSEIPNEISELPNLKYLSISNTKIAQLPDAIWQIPTLENLYLSDNELNIISNEINLPCLKILDLTANQLQTLPMCMGQLPHLKTLSLERNPWQFLPENLDKIPNLSLEITYKQQFFNFEYQGADKKGIVAWDDSVFKAQNDADLMQTIDRFWQNKSVKPFRKDLTALMKKSVRFVLNGEDDYTTIGKHRIGGMPDFPKGMDYPQFEQKLSEGKQNFCCEFIAQINCTDVAHLQNYLPKTGILYFFLTTIHAVYGGEKAAKVIYFNGNNTQLQSGNSFDFTKDDYFDSYADIPYVGYRATAEAFVDFPDFYPIQENPYVLEELSQSFVSYLIENEDYGYDLNELFAPFEKKDVAMNSYGFSQHEYPEHEVALQEKGNPQDWIILLKVPSVGSFQWGDAGDLFFVIHKSDLAKQDFSNVVCTMYGS